MSSDSDRIYLDHNATSPLRPVAHAAIVETLRSVPGNPSSLHTEGRAARAVMERAREQVAALVGVPAQQIVFTSGGSEGIAAGIHGICHRAGRDRRRLVVSKVEHSAVLDAARGALELGFEVDGAGCNGDGRVAAGQVIPLLGDQTALVVLQWANNETGVTQPVQEVALECHRRGIPILVDAVQAAGKIAIDEANADADLLVLSSHKLGGPQGVGALSVRGALGLAPLIGGTQERRRRGGTPSVALIAGFGAAAAEAQAHLKDESQRLLRSRARIETHLRELYPEIRFHGQAVNRLPNTVNFALPGVPGETLTIALDLAGFAASTGSACASGAVEPSHVIQAMGYDQGEARTAVRISLGWSTTNDEIERFLDAVPSVVSQVRTGLRETV